MKIQVPIKQKGTLFEEIEQLKVKIKILGSLRRFKELAERGEKFAKSAGIVMRDVLEDD